MIVFNKTEMIFEKFEVTRTVQVFFVGVVGKSQPLDTSAW